MTRHRVHVLPWLRRPGSLFLRDWLAITIGIDILTWRSLSEAELEHELEHVRQWRRHGWFFPLIYLAGSLGARLAGGRWYDDNPFERTAREATAALLAAGRKQNPPPRG
jgi:hypothetical protein